MWAAAKQRASARLEGEAAALPARLRWRRPPAVGAAQGLVMEARVALPAQRPAGVPVQARAARPPWLRRGHQC